MTQDKLLKTLQDMGLSENEAKVYFSALSLGPTTVLKLSKTSSLKRTTIYSVIESLKEQGLMSMVSKGLKNLFTAESPENLANIIRNRQESLDKNLPEMLSLYKFQESGSMIKRYEGWKAVKSVYEMILKDIKINDYYLAFFNPEKWHALDEKFTMKHVEDRGKRSVNTRLIMEDSEIARNRKKFERNFNEQIKIMPVGNEMTESDLVITPQHFFVVQLFHPISGILIDNKNLIKTEKRMFDMIWESLPEK